MTYGAIFACSSSANERGIENLDACKLLVFGFGCQLFETRHKRKEDVDRWSKDEGPV